MIGSIGPKRKAGGMFIAVALSLPLSAGFASAQVLVRGSELGQGIARARAVGDCTVITAAHVADRVATNSVIATPGSRSAAEVALYLQDADLAVLEVDRPDFPCDGWNPPAASVDNILSTAEGGSILSRRDDGSVVQVPVLITSRDDRWVRVRPRFPDQSVRQSDSGSAFLGAGSLLGILLSVRDDGTANVLRIDRVRAFVDSWYGSRLGDGTCSPRPAPDPDGWVTLVSSEIDYLPPLPDAAGAPDFYLRTRIGDVSSVTWQIWAGRVSESVPFRARSLVDSRGVSVSIYESDWAFFGSGEEPLVQRAEFPTVGLYGCQRVLLDIRPEIFTKYTGIDRSRDVVGVTLRAVPFDPEGESGSDATQGGAEAVPVEDLYFGSISLSERDATDHLAFPAAAEPRIAVLWVRGNGSPDVTSLRGERFVRPIARPDSSANPWEAIYEVTAPAGAQTVLRLRGNSRLDDVSYALFIYGSDDVSAETAALLGTLLEGEPEEYRGPRSWDDEMLRRTMPTVLDHFRVPTAAVLDAMDQHLVDRNAMAYADTATFASPRGEGILRSVARVFGILEGDLATYSAATDTSRRVVHKLITILDVESGASDVDRAALAEAARVRNSRIAVRAIEAIGTLGDRSFAQEVLPDLLLVDNERIASAARRVLRDFR